MSPSQLTLGACSAAAIGLAYGPWLVAFGQELWSKPHYQHFPFVLLAAGLLGAQRLREKPLGRSEREGQSAWPTYLAYAVAWALLGLAYAAYSPLLAGMSAIVLIGGWLLTVTRRTGKPFPWGPWLLLWLVVPPPLGLDGRLMQALQHTSSRLSSYTLDLFGVNHLMDGNALMLPGKQLFVDEACSGIISVVSIVACAAMYGVWRRRAGLHVVLLILMAAGWAALLNVVRIVSIAQAWVQAGIDWSEGVPHTALGLGVFALSLVVLMATDWLLKALLAEVGSRWDRLTGEPLRFGSTLVSLWDRFADGDAAAQSPGRDPTGFGPHFTMASMLALGVVPTIAFASLGASQFTNIGLARTAGDTTEIDTAAFVERLMTESMPPSVAEMELLGVEHEQRTVQSLFGEHSVLYEYRVPTGDRYLLSCDFFFRDGWHELSECYQGIGWRIENREIRRLANTAEQPVCDFVEVDLTKPDGRAALVTFAACFVDGTAIDAPGQSFVERIGNAFSRKNRGIRRQPSFQVQVLTERGDAISETDRKNAELLFAAARERFAAAAQQVERSGSQ